MLVYDKSIKINIFNALHLQNDKPIIIFYYVCLFTVKQGLLYKMNVTQIAMHCSQFQCMSNCGEDFPSKFKYIYVNNRCQDN